MSITNAKVRPPSDDEIRSIIEIESHPDVKRWLYAEALERINPNLEEEFQSYKAFFKKLSRNRRVDILLAKDNETVLGFLSLWRLEYMEHIASLGLSVHPNFWGKGVATQLGKCAIKIARQSGIKRVEIETMSENISMRNVAEKLGFKLECTRKKRVKKNGVYHDETAYFLLL